MANPLLRTHARTLTTYRAALTTAQAQIAELQNNLADLKALLDESRGSEGLWQRQCADLDRYTRVQALELVAAKRVAREAGQELARVRVEFEDLRQGVKRVRRNPPVLVVRTQEAGAQKAGEDGEDVEQEVVREWVEATGVLPEAARCDCPTARAVRGLFEDRVRRRDRDRDRREAQWQYVPPVPPLLSGSQTGERERRRVLREKLKATREKMDGRRERAGEWTGERGRERDWGGRRGNSTIGGGVTATFEV